MEHLINNSSLSVLFVIKKYQNTKSEFFIPIYNLTQV